MYISEFPVHIHSRLNKLRSIIQEKAQEAKEGILYGMPGYNFYKKLLIYFGGFAAYRILCDSLYPRKIQTRFVDLQSGKRFHPISAR